MNMTVEAEQLGEVFDELQDYADSMTDIHRQKALAKEVGRMAFGELKRHVADAKQEGLDITYTVTPREGGNTKLLVVNKRLGGYGGNDAEGSREVTADSPFDAQDIDEGQIDKGHGEFVESFDFMGPKVPVPKRKRARSFRFDPIHTDTMWRLQVPFPEISGIKVEVKLGGEVVLEWPPSPEPDTE